MSYLKEIKNEIAAFNKASDDAIRLNAISKSNHLVLMLDNDGMHCCLSDSVYKELGEEDYYDLCDSLYGVFTDDVGNRQGVFTLLEMLNIKAHRV